MIFKQEIKNHCHFNYCHDRGLCYIETSPLICRANQWTGFYMIRTSVMKELSPFFPGPASNEIEILREIIYDEENRGRLMHERMLKKNYTYLGFKEYQRITFGRQPFLQ